LHHRKPNNVVAAANESGDLVGKRLERLAMLPLVARPGIDRGRPVSDMSVTKDDAQHMGWKSNIAEQCRYRAAQVVSVPSRRAGEPM
jgi:hypothetical protein